MFVSNMIHISFDVKEAIEVFVDALDNWFGPSFWCSSGPNCMAHATSIAHTLASIDANMT
jgi:hypothetical protein